MTVEEYLPFDIVAEVLERRRATIEEWAVSGQLATVQLPGGERRVPRVALEPRRRVSESDE